MKPFLIFLFLFFTFLNLYPQEQHSNGPVKDQNWYTYAYSASSGSGPHYIGDNAGGGVVVTYICFVNWQWNEMNIPNEATLTSINIKFKAGTNNFTQRNLDFTIHWIDEDWSAVDFDTYAHDIHYNDNRKVFGDSKNSDASGNVSYEKTVTNGAWFDAVKDAITNSNHYMTLAIRSESGGYPFWEIYGYDGSPTNSPSIGITFNFTTPTQNYTFFNKFGSNENYGDLVFNNDYQNPFPSGTTKHPSWGSDNTVRTDELPFDYNWNQSGTTQKHLFWHQIGDENDKFVLNDDFQAGSTTPVTMKANFKKTSQVRLVNSIEGMVDGQGDINFIDPFYYYENNNIWYQDNEPKTYSSPFTTSNNSENSYGGVFLDQDPYFLPNVPNYSVQAISQQPITLDGIGTRNFYFRSWGGTNVTFDQPNELTTGVVFTNSTLGETPVASATLKGQGLSNEQNAYSNSQRKFVQSISINDNYLFNTYSSLNKAWAEKAPNITNWQLFDDGTQLNSNVAKGVTLDYSQTYVGQDLANLLLVVFQEKVGISSNIKVLCYTNYSPFSNPPVGWRLEDTKDFFVTNDYDNLDCTPVVAFYGSQFKIVIKKSDGLWFLNGDVTHHSTDNKFHISFNSSLAHITGTNSNSVNPSIAAAKNWSNYVQLVWQEDNTIKYIESITANPTIQTISSGYGYNGNANPSIVVLGDGHGRVCWRASYCRIQADEEVEAQNPLCNPRVVFRGTNYSHFWVFGYNTGSPNINKSDDDTYYAIAWSQYDGDSTYFADNSLSSVHSIGIPGKYVQVSNGATKNQMYAEIFNLQTTPYSFTTSNSLGSYYIPRKILSYSFASGRKGVIHKGDAQFFFTVGDIIVDGQPVDFVTIPDTLDVNTKGLMNQYLKTEMFQLTDNSNFLYSVEYGITDSLAAVNLFANTNKQVTFELQLIDAQTSEVLASYDEITYDQSNLPIYNNYSYEVNVQGIGSRTVYLRLKVNNNFNPDYALGELYAIGSTLQKSTVKHRDFSNDGIVTVYDLYQNYPNPFNPATTINYQLPQTGHVTLKVYDILGKEVATLVNEQKNQGRYSVNLDGSRLASGVYIYQLRVNDYVSSKKMILLK